MFKAALGTYLKDGNSSKDEVYRDEEFVVVKDRYPKAVLHWLILVRDTHKNLHTNPAQLLKEDGEFYAKCSKIVDLMKSLAAEQLAEKYNCSIDRVVPRIRAGVHTAPSMSHMHIHILSTDMVSAAMKNARHYNSFTTDFFVDFDSIPALPEFRLNQSRMEHEMKRAELVCYHCGKKFGRMFAKLKPHLNKELQTWEDNNRSKV